MTVQTNSSSKLTEQKLYEAPQNSGSSTVPSRIAQQYQESSSNINDSFYRSRLPRSTHWSVAWSDLMMTMFVLFLSMFVYQAAHKDFLVSDTPEVVGGSTTDAIDVDEIQDLIVPIVPFTHNAPLITGGTVLKVKELSRNELDIDDAFLEAIVPPPEEKTIVESDPEPVTESKVEVEDQEVTVVEEIIPTPVIPPQILPEQDVIEPAPIIDKIVHAVEEKPADTFSEIYDASKQTLDKYNLEKFASIEIVPDKTMRIILTGDLLFSVGQAELSPIAKESLLKIAAVIKNSPYMINVIGHTDNSPMHSQQFASNWELSVVRASSVTRFLIGATQMNPQQFIVSGYGSHRPRKANTNTANRAANRRVEIIISKRLPPAVKATSENLL
jgi:chemotaxis protein MotB